jgi:hypothetical protein
MQFIMKIQLLLLFAMTMSFLHAQKSASYDSAINFFNQKGLKLNTVTPPEGFTVYYNCDSLLFMRGDFNDTIKIWTSGADFYNSLDNFKNIIKDKSFGQTQFAKHIDNDGRIYVSTYHQTEFIYRNDSLYEIENSNPTSSKEISKLFDDYLFKQTIDQTTYNNRLDSLNLIEKRQAIYTPKLIFTKSIFQKNKLKIKLPKKLNFMRDTVELEKQWIENGKNCYLVRINNNEDGQKTTYAYAINDDMQFVFWQGCITK